MLVTAAQAPYHELPGSLRLVFDISPAGQRWFEFRLLRCGPHGMWLDEQPVSLNLACGPNPQLDAGRLHHVFSLSASTLCRMCDQ
jgi:hypothetical protein